MRIAIIGAGLAGAALANRLRGHDVVVYEAAAEPASGASGNEIGMYNPRLFAELTPEALYHNAAFQLALDEFARHEDVDWNPCGALHLITDEKREKRYRKMTGSWDWPEEDLCIVSAQEASDIAGVPLQHDALYIRQSGYVSPRKLVKQYLKDIDVHYNMRIETLQNIEADIIILACAWGASAFDAARNIPLSKVRGQVTRTVPSAVSQNLKCCLNYGGYTTPPINGEHCIGASFQRWLDHTDLLPQDDADNIEKLESVLPGAAEEMKIIRARASLRTTSPDHFPVVGALDECTYISTAHGSHGILSSLMAAEIIAAQIEGTPLPLPESVVKGLSPHRFA